MTHWIRDGNDVSAQHYDLNNAMVDSIADMLPALREEARRRAVEAAQEQVRLAERKLARLQAADTGAQA
jgi:capsule polysaccharide export protein KpsE/RkpR